MWLDGEKMTVGTRTPLSSGLDFEMDPVPEGESPSPNSLGEHQALILTNQMSTSTLSSKIHVEVDDATDDNVDEEEKEQENSHYLSTLRYWMNLLFVSVSFMLIFSSFLCLANLQTSLNQSAGLGATSLCVIYIGAVVSGFLTPLVISILKVKWTLVVCSIFYGLYVASNLYPVALVMIPAAALVGLACSPLWTAAGTYITTSAIQYSELSGDTAEVVINRFNGVFFFTFQTSQVWGNLISSSLLFSHGDISAANASTGECGRESCGALATSEIGNATLAATDNTNMDRPTFNLIVIDLSICILATGIFAFLLDPLPATRQVLEKPVPKKATVSGNLMATAVLLKSRTFLLLIPLIICAGMFKAFIGADFTKAYVTCTRGKGAIGYVMIGMGVASAFSSAIFGHLEKYVGRIPIIVFGGLLQTGLLTALDLWNPEGSALWQLITLAAAWGVGDSVWNTQISSVLGVLFSSRQEAAFANFRLWDSVGYAILYGLTLPYMLCLYHRLYILVGVLVFAMLCYLTDEYLIARKTKRLAEEKGAS